MCIAFRTIFAYIPKSMHSCTLYVEAKRMNRGLFFFFEIERVLRENYN